MGGFGRYQIWAMCLIVLSKLPVDWHLLNVVIIGPPPASVRCSNSNDSCDPLCERYIIDVSPFEKTIISEWNLVCNRRVLAATGQSLVMFGMLTGAIVFGVWGDIKGRRLPLAIAMTVQAITGSATAFVPWLWAFLALRFVTAFVTAGSMCMSFVLLMELIGKRWRMPIGCLYHIPTAVGHLALAGIGYAWRDWRHSQLIVSLPSFAFIVYFCLLPESPRWLIAAGKVDRAIVQVTRIARHNRLPTDNIDGEMRRYVDENAKGGAVKHGFCDLFRPCRMFVRTTVVCFMWLAAGLCFYGVAQYASYMSGDIFVNIAMSASCEVPGVVFTAVMITLVGAKWTTMIMSAFAGVPMLAVPFLDDDSLVIPSMALCAMFGLAGMFAAVYVYTGQMYPTIIRSAAVGVGSMIARCGSMSAPWITGMSEFSWGARLVPIVYGTVPLVGATLTYLLLPNTRNAKLPETIEDALALGKKR